ncbi:MAG: hypothetical protein ACWA6Y_13545 [Polaromonas sp.]
MSEAAGDASVLLQEGRFSGRSEFAALIRQAMAAAASQGWREIILSDADFSQWPLGERAVAQALNDWASSGRKFTMLAANYDLLPRQHARFVVWRKTWSHLVQCRRPASGAGASVPSILWSPGWYVECLDLQRCTGVAGTDAVRRLTLKKLLDERFSTSAPAFPSSVLGL